VKFIDVVRDNLTKYSEERDALTAEADSLTEDRDAFGEAEEARGEEIVARLSELNKLEADAEARLAELEENEIRMAAAKTVPTRAPRTDRLDEGRDLRSYSVDEARGAALSILERDGAHLKARQLDNYDSLVRRTSEQCDGNYIARRAIVTSSEAYRSAFYKGMYGVTQFTPEEQRAVAEYQANEMRAGSHTTTAGGFGVPVLIDPSIILTSGAADAPLLRYCRIENITTDVWKGVAGVAPSWAVVAEGSASTDAFPTLAQPIVTTYTARTFLPFSIEISQDYPSFEAEFSPLIAQGYTDYIAVKTLVGSGSDIQGVFTALDAVSASEVTVTTDGQLGSADFRKLYANLPEMFRPNATWVFDVTVENVARALSSNGMGSDFTVNLGADGIDRLMGKPICLSDYAPDYTGTTGAANIAVLMDLSGYVFARRVGMSVELIPHLFDVTNNMPTGQRGWFAYARAGGNVVAPTKGRLLQNT
jgi:HK97 family phage major capsid protein